MRTAAEGRSEDLHATTRHLLNGAAWVTEVLLLPDKESSTASTVASLHMEDRRLLASIFAKAWGVAEEVRRQLRQLVRSFLLEEDPSTQLEIFKR